MWIDTKSFEDNVVDNKCDKCAYGIIQGTYTDYNNWCKLHNGTCRNSKDKCDK
ncbi:MAG: hypothetical protein ACRDBY_00720 [Cetobacterium sp.]